MQNKIDTARGAAEYTMGIKFQMKLNIDEEFLGELAGLSNHAPGFLAKEWLPKCRMLLLKRKKRDGRYKVTVYESELLIYSEKYQTCQTLSLRGMKHWEKEKGIYRIWTAGTVFAFRETDFLIGTPSSFEVFLNDCKRRLEA